MHDLIIRNASIFNGLNEQPQQGDVAVKAGRIVAIAPFIAEPAKEIQDASNLWLVPGFIDIHTHYDIEVEISPGLPESVRHGVTSVVMGNCSLSLTMGDPKTLGDIFLRVETLPASLVHRWLNQAVCWDTPQNYFAHLNTLNLGPNVSALLGHSALRAKVMGLQRSLFDVATTQELHEMRTLAREALEAGCIGISVDMVHWHKVSGTYAGRALPSHHAQFKEYKMLAEVCREYDAVFQVTPNPENLFSFLHILRLSPGFFRPPLRNTILSALDMLKHKWLWRIFPILTFICNRLLDCNIRFQTLTEAFTIYADGPLTPVFEEFSTGVLLNSCHTSEERRALWKDKKFQADFKKQWCGKLPHTFHRDFTHMRITDAPDQSMVGKTFTQVAQEQGKKPLDMLCELLATYDDQIRWVSCGANHRPPIRERLMAYPYILPGFSDAGAHSRNLAFFDNALSLLRQAVTTHFISPQRAIERVTSEPAKWFNLDAGEIKVGAKADMVLIRPEKLKEPIPPPTEIADPLLNGAMRLVKRDPNPVVAHVYIAGKEVVRDGEPCHSLGKEKTGEVLMSTVPVKSTAAVLARYRNRINDQSWDHPFTHYWDIFLLKHQNRVNVYFHFVAVIAMYLIPFLALYSKNVWWLLLMPFSQGIGLVGHYFFERSTIDTRDTIFSWRAFLSLNKMFISVLTNRYPHELQRVKQQLAQFKREKVG